MTDNKQAIEEWKRQLAAQGLEEESIEELESHLLDAITEHREQGLSEQDAFDAGCRQLGSPKRIVGEFRKAESLLVADWMVLGLCTLFALTLIGGLIYATIVPHQRERLAADPLLSLHVITLTIGYVALLGFAGLGMYSVLRRLFTRRCEYSWMEIFAYVMRWDGSSCLLLVTVGLVTGAFWSREHNGHYWSWDPKEISGLLVWAWYAVAAAGAWLNLLRPAWIPALGISGGLLCLVAWVGSLGLPITFLFVALCSVLLMFLLSAFFLYRKSTVVDFAE